MCRETYCTFSQGDQGGSRVGQGEVSWRRNLRPAGSAGREAPEEYDLKYSKQLDIIQYTQMVLGHTQKITVVQKLDT